MSDIQNISLAFPCHEKLSRKLDGSFYCPTCAHAVVDFRCQSAEALQFAMRRSTRPVCGIFKKSQLNDQFVRYAAVATVAVSVATGAGCAKEPSMDELPGNAMEITPVEEPSRNGVDAPQDDFLFVGMFVGDTATPEGGMEKFMAAVARALRYPKGLCLDGNVYIQFTVDSLGKTGNFSVVKGIHPLADQEALRVFKSLDYPFKPARVDGKKISCRMVMPVKFRSLVRRRIPG